MITAFSETETSYRTRSLPAWGKLKQRPVTITDDIATLYVKVFEHSLQLNSVHSFALYTYYLVALDEFE